VLEAREFQRWYSCGAPLKRSALVERDGDANERRSSQRTVLMRGCVEDSAEGMMLSLCERLGRDFDATRADIDCSGQREQPVALGGEIVNDFGMVAKTPHFFGQNLAADQIARIT